LLRIVVQRVHGSVCRLVVYGGGQAYRAAEFASLDDVLRRLRSVVPNLDDTAFSVCNQESRDTSIVLSGVIELNNKQLSALGLK
jgi:hypothetical protein